MGTVEHIHLAPGRGSAVVSVDRARAIPGRGLEGDRYEQHSGRWSDEPGSARELTLMEAEEYERFERETGIALAPGEMRRNVTTRGVRLNDLVGRQFHVGAVLCEGVRLCEPCEYLQGLLGKPVLQALVHRAGLRAVILSEGAISVGDAIAVESTAGAEAV